jgi:M6 family metalloprotease-like protein
MGKRPPGLDQPIRKPHRGKGKISPVQGDLRGGGIVPLSAVPIPGYRSSAHLKPLFLLLSFSDNAFSSTNATDYPAFIFSDVPGVRDHSLSDYYREVSGGKLIITGDSLSIYEVDMAAGARSYEYYTNNNAGLGRYKQMVTDALTLADGQVDFSLFDNDGPDGVPGSIDDDGQVDALVVVHAGPAAEYFGTPDYYDHMFSHYDSYGTDWVSGEGTVVRDWAMVPERDPVDGSAGAEAHVGSLQWSLGTLAHEFGHILGLPDLYDGTLTNFGLGHYDLMSFGLYGMDTFDRTYYDTAFSTPSWDRPGYPSAWSRVYLGWIQPVAVHADTTLALWRAEDPAPALTPQVLKIWKADSWSTLTPWTPDEYFLLEHRQSKPGSYDVGFSGSGKGGLLIYHVDGNRLFDISGNIQPYPNDYNASDPVKGLDLEEADWEEDLEQAFGQLLGDGNFGDFSGFPEAGTKGDFYHSGQGYFWDLANPADPATSHDNDGNATGIRIADTVGTLSSASGGRFAITVDLITGISTVGYTGTTRAGPFVIAGGTFDDGDDDAWVTAEAEVLMRVEVRHAGMPNTAYGVRAVIDSPDLHSVSNSYVYYGDLPALASSTGNGEFLFSFAQQAKAFTWVPITLTIVDESDNLSSEQIYLPVITPPNAPPVVVILEGPEPVGKGSSAAFTWSGDDPDGTVDGYFIGLDSAGDPSIWTTANSVTYTDLANGDHTFKIYAVDNDGDRSELVQWSFNLKKSSGGGGPCFVATALWGTEHWKTERLRAFRDGYMARSAPGQRLIQFYYRHSPGPARWVGNRQLLRKGLSAVMTTILWPLFL